MFPGSCFSLIVITGRGSLIKAMSLPSVVTFLLSHLSWTMAFSADMSNLFLKMKFWIAAKWIILWWNVLLRLLNKIIIHCTYFWAFAHRSSSQSGSVSICQSPKVTRASWSLMQWAAVITYRRLIKAPPHLYLIFDRRFFL